MSLRSLLFAPADSPRKVEKALASAADCVILDLEDAVAQSSKAIAREAAVAVLSSSRNRLICVRVNGPDSEYYIDDIRAILAVAPDFVMIPKCDSPAILLRVHHHVEAIETGVPGRVGLLPLVTESAAALGSMDYRGVTPMLKGLCFAGEDLGADLGIATRDGDGLISPPLALARTRVVIAAAAACVAAIDTPFPDPQAPELLRAEARSAAGQGFVGKMCIHPEQIAIVHEEFRPGAERIIWANAVIAAFQDNEDIGVATLGGKMIDKAHLKLAKRMRDLAGELN